MSCFVVVFSVGVVQHDIIYPQLLCGWTVSICGGYPSYPSEGNSGVSPVYFKAMIDGSLKDIRKLISTA